ncbi:right-handed parallel beta-helix repeat-containing protein [Puniceibacterium sediminis]|uniref:Uncharacterized protein n=1 Tax=Puniceibacterium sediminis TaxID=1608407 RepID=A0A238ZWP5_9RHOB|nr:right-handed parallel beta-helix repeat-containing protein [Puniceibacterium sediminis]SNR87750.1 hypothetical protein SAMN06265370_1472 [Puniceibacterium sediminis]
MALLNLNNRVHVPDYAGRQMPKNMAFIYRNGTDILVPLFQDPDLTLMLAQPLIANVDGDFEICHVMSGRYDVRIVDNRERSLCYVPRLQLRRPDAVGYAHIFPAIPDLMADDTLRYEERVGHYQVTEGEFLQTANENIRLRVGASDAPDHHLETAGGVRLSLVDRIWPAAAFGVVADSDLTGESGTDNSASLAALAAALATQDQETKVVFPCGVIRTSEVFNVESAVIRDITITGEGTRIIFTHPSPAQNRRYFSVRNSDQRGARCIVRGLTLDLARNPVRTGGSDMISIGGFADVTVSENVIPSADNMAIAIDRGTMTQPRSVQVNNNRIGGKLPVSGTAHEYGSVGDTGIWVQHAGFGTVITGNVIYGTGDDAICIAETSVSPAYAPAIISNNVVKNCQGTAYKTGAAYTVFSGNYAENTVNDMYRIIDLSTKGGTTVPHGFQINGGFGKGIGRADGASLGVDIVLAGNHRAGVHIQGAAGRGSITGLHLFGTGGEAIKVTTGGRACAGLEVRSCVFDDIGAPGTSVFRRDGGANAKALTNVTFAHNVIRNTTARMLAWECRVAEGAEGNLSWHDNDIINCDFSSNSTVFAFVGDQTQRLENIHIRADRWTDNIPPSTSLLDIADASPEAFDFWFFDEGALTSMPVGSVRMRNNQSPGAIGLVPERRVRRACRKTIGETREFNNDNVLLTLDPAKAWEIEAKAIRNSDATLDIVYYKATWDPVRGRVLHVTSIAGGPDGNCAVELAHVTPLDIGDQVFFGSDVLQLQGTGAGWTDGGTSFDPLVHFEITWREVVENGHAVKIR